MLRDGTDSAEVAYRVSMHRLVHILLILISMARGQDASPQIAGNYSDGQRSLAIAPWQTERGQPEVLAFTDFVSGRFGVLKESGSGYETGPGIFPGEHPDIAIIQRAPGVITYSAPDITVSIRRSATRAQEIEFPAAGTNLHGTLLLPSGEGPFPAIAIVPGADLGRHGAATFPNFFLSRGLAVLIYDRRPHQPDDPLTLYADDALAAVHFLRQCPEVDPKRIGLWGHSQGGWLSLVAASKSTDVSFVIDHSGMVMAAWRQELYRVTSELKAEGAAAADVDKATRFIMQEMKVARTGKGWQALTGAAASGKGKRWREKVYVPNSLEELQRFWKTDFSVDPSQNLRSVRCPVLGLFGALDLSTPPENADILRTALRKAGNKQVTTIVFPTANHAFFDATTGTDAELPKLHRFAPGMFDTLTQWLNGILRR